MHKYLMKIMIVIFVLAAIVWLQPTTIFASSTMPNSCSYGPFDYKNAPNTSTPRGTLSGNSVTNWSSNCFSWQVDSNTYGPSGGYGIEATGYGGDRCQATDAWVRDMFTDQLKTNTSTYTNAGLKAGAYLDCGQSGNHSYYVQCWPGWFASSTTKYETWGTWMY